MIMTFRTHLILAFLPICLGLSVPPILGEAQRQAVFHTPPTPVPVVLGVMSRCPDALICENVFDKVISQIGHQKMNLSLTFIATIDPAEAKYGVRCKHGRKECRGNIHELCTIAHTPKTPTSSQWWWPFLHCINFEGRRRIGSKKVSRKCAALSGIDWRGSGIAECVSGDEGKALLKESIQRTRDLGIEKSCTILINNKLRCIRDSMWKSCDEGHEPVDFIGTINEEYAKLNPGIET